MDEKHRLSGFRALLESHKTNSYHLVESDGSYRLWQDLSAEAKLESIVSDAAYYAVPFEPFVEAVRESVDAAVMEEAALRLALRSGRELHDLERLFPDDGRTEPPPPLVERVSELLHADFPEHEDEPALTVEQLKALFKEMREDRAAAMREDAHWYGKEAAQENLKEKTKNPARAKDKDREIER